MHFFFNFCSLVLIQLSFIPQGMNDNIGSEYD